MNATVRAPPQATQHYQQQNQQVYYQQQQMYSRHQASSHPHDTSSASHRGAADNLPSIRLIAATPSASGISGSEPNTTASSIQVNGGPNSSWGTIPSHIPPHPTASSPLTPSNKPVRRLVPKKSKINILPRSVSQQQEKPRAPGDFSDVVRRLGGDSRSASARGGFEIYVDPAEDPEFSGEVLLVKKKKSRPVLNGLRWGSSSALEEVTNVPSARATKEAPQILKVKEENTGGSGRWWSMGRGRKESKEKENKDKDKDAKKRAKSPGPGQDLPPRSQTPQPFKPVNDTASRARFNSFDAGRLMNMSSPPAQAPAPELLSKGTGSGTAAPPNTLKNYDLQPAQPAMSRSQTPNPMPSRSQTPNPYQNPSRSATPNLLAVPGLGGENSNANASSSNQGSIAVRAMRSMRSMAKLGGWINGSGSGDENVAKEKEVRDAGRENKKSDKKDKADKSADKEDKKPKKKSKKKSSVPAAQTLRQSSSSFEAGQLTSSPSPGAREKDAKKQSIGKKKSILGLGLPSTMRLPNVRSGSTASSILAPIANTVRMSSQESAPGVPAKDNNRLSVESALLGGGRARSASASTNASSLRPLSTSSCATSNRTSSGSSCISNSGSSVRWDEEKIESMKDMREKERKRKSDSSAEDERTAKRRENRHSAEGRKRTPLSDVFPESVPESPERSVYSQASDDSMDVDVDFDSVDGRMRAMRGRETPMVIIEAATADGHSIPDDGSLGEDVAMDVDGEEKVSTPAKKARRRPMSEQMLGRSRPRAIHEESGDGVLSMLDAATNDLAQLINHLDLEATPATPDLSPAQQGVFRRESQTSLAPASPTRRTLRPDLGSIQSLRPYAQCRSPPKKSSLPPGTGGLMLGQQIAPWPVLNVTKKPSVQGLAGKHTPPKPTFRPMHKRTETPVREPERSPELLPLKPSTRPRSGTTSRVKEEEMDESPVARKVVKEKDVRVSMQTFGGGSRSSSRSGSQSSVELPRSAEPVFSRKPSTLALVEKAQEHTLTRSTRRQLGMHGTLGASDVSAYQDEEQDASDPDSDIPNELQAILNKNFVDAEDADTLSFVPPALTASANAAVNKRQGSASPPSPGPAPTIELPSFRLTSDSLEDHLFPPNEFPAEIDEGFHSSSEDDNTKKSFDFTGELKRLNESGGSDRRSFVEQLENAFRTPAKLDLRYDFDGKEGVSVEVPPVPSLPAFVKKAETSSDESREESNEDSADSLAVEVSRQESSVAVADLPDALSTSFIPVLTTESQLMDVKPSFTEVSTSSITEGQALKNSGSNGSLPGQLKRDFKFGGRSKEALKGSQSSATSQPAKFALPSMSYQPSKPSPKDTSDSMPLTLSDIIPSASHVRSLSMGSLAEVSDDSVMRSIMDKAVDLDLPPRPSAPIPRTVSTENDSQDISASQSVNTSGETSTESVELAREAQRRKRASMISNRFSRHSRASSVLSFVGFDSFDEVRRGFEFNDQRPGWYPPPPSGNYSAAATFARRAVHGRQESAFSFASVSSYGRVVNPGVPDPFEYGLPSLRERPSSEDLSMSMHVDDTFSFLNHEPRRRVDSDASTSSFYFRPPGQAHRGHRRGESNLSVISQGPPISLYNRSFGGHGHSHRRGDSSSSISSVALSYAMHGANGGRSAWARHRPNFSVDSVSSDFSGGTFSRELGRPGIGDKMFDTAAAPLPAISGSPRESVEQTDSYDSIIDNQRYAYGLEMEDSLFERTGERSSVSEDDSVFGRDLTGHHLLPNPAMQGLRPPSMWSLDDSFGDGKSPRRDDDTMLSMYGQGRVRRKSVSSAINASPCAQINNARSARPRTIEVKPSIASTSSSKFGGERMIKARHGVLERQSLEESCLIAEGEDFSLTFNTAPVFSKPETTTRSRSSTCTTSSSGIDTPPLSSSDGSSISGGSQSSIDLGHVNMMLANSTHPIGNPRVRSRARGSGHRRRISEARMSRVSLYETIEEETPASSPHSLSSFSSQDQTQRNQGVESKKSSPTAIQPVYVVEDDVDMDAAMPEDRESVWDDERGIVALKRYYDLRDEAEHTVAESRRVWSDTPFSMFALQSFQPPRHPAGMQALLQHSVENYGPLPHELRPYRVRSRTSSRASPYPVQGRVIKLTSSPEQVKIGAKLERPRLVGSMNALKEMQVFSNANLAPESPYVPTSKDNLKDKRPRVGSTARRAALGWSKRSSGPGAGKGSTEPKENSVNVSAGSIIMTPGESLRLSRPRPRGRPTPATVKRVSRV